VPSVPSGNSVPSVSSVPGATSAPALLSSPHSEQSERTAPAAVPSPASPLAATVPAGAGAGALSEVSLEKGPPSRPQGQGLQQQRLLKLQLNDFKLFKQKEICFQAGLLCVLGQNSSGKSTILDAIEFVLLGQCDLSIQSLIRRAKPPVTSTSVVALFEAGNGQGQVTLRREARADGSACDSTFWMGTPSPLLEVSRDEYVSWIQRTLRWPQGHLVLRQFSLLQSRNAQKLLDDLPALLKQLKVPGGDAPLLKRRPGHQPVRQPSGFGEARHSGTIHKATEAWLARRIDEIYRELTREPLDQEMEEWGEGGQACLRRLENGSFSLLVSERRGAAACGYGTPLGRLSDGARDVCALALLFAQAGLALGLQESLPCIFLLDEPDARMDRQHAKALRRFLSGPHGPRQSVVLSLNNHAAFDTGDALQLEAPEEFCYGDADGD